MRQAEYTDTNSRRKYVHISELQNEKAVERSGLGWNASSDFPTEQYVQYAYSYRGQGVLGRAALSCGTYVVCNCDFERWSCNQGFLGGGCVQNHDYEARRCSEKERRKMNQQQSQNGIGFFGLLAIVFIVLKLTGTIDWAWVWVLAPLWIPIAIFILIIVIWFIVLVVVKDR
jgi:hypothetical protein